MLHSVDPAGKGAVLASLLDVELSEKIQLLDDAARSIAEDAYKFSHADLVVAPG